MKGSLAAALAAVLLSAAVNCFALDRIYTSTQSYSGALLIRVYAGDGQRVVDIPIKDEYVEADFLIGRWLGGDGASIVAVLPNEAALSALVLDQAGTLVTQIELGKDVLQVLSLDYAKSGLSDRGVQRRKGPLAVHLDPGTLGGRSATVNAPKNSDAVAVLRGDGENIGFMRLSGDNINTRSLRAAKGKKSKARTKKKKG